MSAAGVSLDTSVLLRLLVAQPIDQFRVAIRFLQAQRANHIPVHVGDLVLAEGYFALLSFLSILETGCPRGVVSVC